MAPMHVKHAREVPEYEINPNELDFANSVDLNKVSYFLVSTIVPVVIHQVYIYTHII